MEYQIFDFVVCCCLCGRGLDWPERQITAIEATRFGDIRTNRRVIHLGDEVLHQHLEGSSPGFNDPICQRHIRDLSLEGGSGESWNLKRGKHWFSQLGM